MECLPRGHHFRATILSRLNKITEVFPGIHRD